MLLHVASTSAGAAVTVSVIFFLKAVTLEDAMAGKLVLENVAAKTAAVVEALEDSRGLIQ